METLQKNGSLSPRKVSSLPPGQGTSPPLGLVQTHLWARLCRNALTGQPSNSRANLTLKEENKPKHTSQAWVAAEIHLAPEGTDCLHKDDRLYKQLTKSGICFFEDGGYAVGCQQTCSATGALPSNLRFLLYRVPPFPCRKVCMCMCAVFPGAPNHCLSSFLLSKLALFLFASGRKTMRCHFSFCKPSQRTAPQVCLESLASLCLAVQLAHFV